MSDNNKQHVGPRDESSAMSGFTGSVKDVATTGDEALVLAVCSGCGGDADSYGSGEGNVAAIGGRILHGEKGILKIQVRVEVELKINSP